MCRRDGDWTQTVRESGSRLVEQHTLGQGAGGTSERMGEGVSLKGEKTRES